jgi:hypothetical protein
MTEGRGAEAEQPEGAAAEESGWVHGRDPRDMSQAGLRAMGHAAGAPSTKPLGRVRSPTLTVTAAIIVHQRPDEPTRTPNKSCRWIAEAVVDGRTFTARSRYGVSGELARVLVATGIPDAPMQVHSAGLCGYAAYRSFHEAAKRTYEESATRPVHRVRWVDPAVRAARIIAAFGPKQGVIAPAATPVPPGASVDVAKPSAAA